MVEKRVDLCRAARWGLTILVLTLTLFFCSAFSISVGSVETSLADAAGILLGQVPGFKQVFGAWWSETQEVVVVQLRLPRLVSAVLAGVALATSGAVFQGMFRNPLADPYVLGVASGAGLGGVAATLLSSSLLPMSVVYARPLLASTTALLTTLIVYAVARTGGRVPVLRLILAGVAVSSLMSALTMHLLFFAGERGHIALAWLCGPFARVEGKWDYVEVAAPVILTCSALMLLFSRDLNVLAMGEEQARHLGVEVELVKKALLALASIATAAAVAISGVIGFVGLIVPHAMRLIVGPDHRVLLPSSALAGATLLVACDTLIRARVIAPASELPVGTITAMMGCPFFLYLLVKSRRLVA